MGLYVALDIGIASVGWAVVDSEKEIVLEAGSNIFPEANAAENVSRRSFRQGKRLKRRQRTRLDDFNKLWVKYNFTIPQTKITNVVELREKALTENVSTEQIYVILYSLLKHRGISYLEDAGDESTAGSSSYAKGLAINQKELTTKYPCQIQNERLKKYGKYRGQNVVTDENGEIIDLSNVFTTSAYRNEANKILETQQLFDENITDEFISDYITIFNRKRKYYEGPGNELSRTNYGIYTTNIDDETGKFITESNIFEKLIGKCSIYKDELRASAASYTAQEFNILNDLNNLVVNGEKLTTEQKHKIVDIVKVSDSINMRKIITNVIGCSIETMAGARVDKDDKEIFHSFQAYNKMRKELKKNGYDITLLQREDLDEIGYILTINTDKESIVEAFKEASVIIDDSVIDCLIDTRKKDSSLFNKWHSFSLKLMNDLIPEMYDTEKEQMTLLTEMGLLKSREAEFEGLKYIPVESVSEELLNPVVRRSVRTSIKIINALLKKYGSYEQVIIEMPRDGNSDEEKNRIKTEQSRNEKELKEIEALLVSSYDIEVKKSDYGNQKQLALKLKLWNEQDGICMYSGKKIDPLDVIYNPDLFEVDHIIPRSISFDDSRANKVLVYRAENQKKGNQTPYFYLIHNSNSNWSYEQYRAKVIELSKKKKYGISRKKVQNFLFEQDITKIEVMQGFIARNLNDTRYASKVVLNTLQSFFKAKQEETKVKVLRGSYTHQMRVNLKLDKNREESYSHHAVDAMLIAFSQMGYESYKHLQGKFIDFETGEILDSKMWNENMTDDVYQEYLYGRKWSEIRNYITEAEKNVKYSFYVDKKVNRGLCNQTIRGTRDYNGKTFKINKLDIRSKNGIEVFKKLAFSEKERERLLVYKNDIQTFNDLVQIYNDYKDSPNPFVQYEKETGDLVRKYAKNHKGPKIECLKYTDGEVGSCIDISHKYGYEKGSKKVILESLVPYRTDVYCKEDGSFWLVGLKQSDLKSEKGQIVIDEESYSRILVAEKMIKPDQTIKDLEKLGFMFKFSLYKNDIIEYEKDGNIFRERFSARTMPKVKNYIETKPIGKAKYEKQNLVGLAKTKYIKKIRVDVLGNIYEAKDETFKFECK